MVNIHEKTGIRFGYIPASLLDSDLVHELTYGCQVTDESFEDYRKELAYTHGWDGDEDIDLFYADSSIAWQELEECHIEEPIVSGLYEGVNYRSSWLGGALNFFILESPHIVKAPECSPCVPNAGDLQNTTFGGVECYGVPVKWLDRGTTDIEDIIMDVKHEDVKLSGKTKQVTINLSFMTRVEYAETVCVPVEFDEENLDNLVIKAYDVVDGGDYTDDPDYIERGSCYISED